MALNEVETINVLNILKYEKYQKVLNGLLEQGALLCMQFWTGYLDDMPNMQKSCEVGHRVLDIDRRIMKNWKKMQDIYPSNPKDLLSYSLYLRQIWNDEEYAQQIAEKAKESSYSNNHATIFNTNMNDIASFALDGAACAFISGEKATLGHIKNCNLAFCRLFGYLKKDIVGSNIKIFMPELIGKHHDRFLLENLEKIEISTCSTTTRTIFSIGMHKSRYIFPLSVKILSNPNILNEMHYVAKLTTDKKIIKARICYLLLNKEGHVVGLSSTCVSMLNISVNTLSNYILDINVMAPSLFRHDLPRKYNHKSGSLIDVYYPEASEAGIFLCQYIVMQDCAFKENLEVMERGSKKQSFQCYLTELKYSLSLIHICRCRRIERCRSRWSPYH
eukprot:TRINITY_DN16851_c0_g1_i3.p2 TRINITY_DN16851_c0_g1~~TRINITY_DN16851_c0_g1_i3.p2  ORF type:complete len:389 (-),score=85.65 TRINITY_DN16851_c0_g1_i3:17-1183(-)